KQPAQKEPAAAASNAGAGGSGTEHSQAQPTTPSWGDSHDGGQVRAVRRVRVEGGMPLPVSPAVQRFSTQPHAAGGGALDTGNGRNGAPASSVWAPLDGLSADSESYAPVQNDCPESTVREVRRSKVVDGRRQVWQGADLQGDVATAGASQTAPPLYSYGFEVADDVPAGYEESTVTEGSERPTGAAVATGDAAPVPLSDPLQPVAEAGASQ